MAVTATTSIRFTIGSTLANTVGQVASASATLAKDFITTLVSGVGAGQADKVFAETRTIAASGTFDWDLAGTLVDIFGAVCTFARVKLIALFADPLNTNNVVLGNAAATQFLGPFGAAVHTAAIRPGGAAIFFAPDATAWAVGAGATDLLRATNSAAGTGVTFDIIIVGASA